MISDQWAAAVAQGVAQIEQRRKRPEAERFWEKVNQDGPAPVHRPELGACWLWTGATVDGYGMFPDADRRMGGAHRWAYVNTLGAIPEGLELDHLCRVRHCVRPDHLEPVTHLENVRRGLLARS